MSIHSERLRSSPTFISGAPGSSCSAAVDLVS
jgi:hypothetical protein